MGSPTIAIPVRLQPLQTIAYFPRVPRATFEFHHHCGTIVVAIAVIIAANVVVRMPIVIVIAFAASSPMPLACEEEAGHTLYCFKFLQTRPAWRVFVFW